MLNSKLFAHDVAARRGCGFVAGQVLHTDRIAQDMEPCGRQQTGALGHTLAVEVDIEVHVAANGMRIEADELEHLAGIGRPGIQHSRPPLLLAQAGLELLVAGQRAARIELGHLASTLLHRHLHPAQGGVVEAHHRVDLGTQIQARARLGALVGRAD